MYYIFLHINRCSIVTHKSRTSVNKRNGRCSVKDRGNCWDIIEST